MLIKLVSNKPGQSITLKSRDEVFFYIVAIFMMGAGIYMLASSLSNMATLEKPLHNIAAGLIVILIGIASFVWTRLRKWKLTLDVTRGAVIRRGFRKWQIPRSAITDAWIGYDEIQGRGNILYKADIWLKVNVPPKSLPLQYDDTALALEWSENYWCDEHEAMWNTINEALEGLGFKKPLVSGGESK